MVFIFKEKFKGFFCIKLYCEVSFSCLNFSFGGYIIFKKKKLNNLLNWPKYYMLGSSNCYKKKKLKKTLKIFQD